MKSKIMWNSHPIAVPSRQVLQSANAFRFKASCTSLSLIILTSLLCCANFLPNQHNNSSSLHGLPNAFAHVSGLEDALVNYIFGRKKATEVAHIVWRNVVQKGDTVIDATCGNGYDTLAMLKMIADDSGKGCVYGFDIQPESIVSTSFLLDSNVNQEMTCLRKEKHESPMLAIDPIIGLRFMGIDLATKQQVQLFNISHSKMDEVVPSDTAVRLVAFNLGYLPGGDKRIITMSETTVLALEAATELLMSGGMISLVVYIGHLGGREELEAIEGFASRLRVDRWTCCKVQALNRPLAPVLIFMFKR